MAEQQEGPVQRLARVVKARRLELGLGQRSLKALGGPSVVTVVRVERGEEPPPRDLTLFALDRALGWTYGSSMGVLLGHPDCPTVAPAEQGDVTVTEENPGPEPEVDQLPVGRGREGGEVLKPDDFTPEQWRDLRRYAEFIRSQNPDAQ